MANKITFRELEELLTELDDFSYNCEDFTQLEKFENSNAVATILELYELFEKKKRG